MSTYTLYPLGIVHQLASCQEIKLRNEYKPALLHIEKFSHLILFWLNSNRKQLLKQSGEDNELTEYIKTAYIDSLSPIEMTVAKIKYIKDDVIGIGNAIIPDNAAVIDVKSYFPVSDRVKEFDLPDEYSSVPEFLPETLSHNMTNLLQSGRFSCRNDNSDNITVKQAGKIHKKSGECRIEFSDADDEFFGKLDSFSHINIFWWFNRFDKEDYRKTTQCNPPYENAPRTGVFASRSPVRPNPIALTTARIIRINRKKKVIDISPVDAFHNSPVIDVKPYLPLYRVLEYKIPEWIDHWSEWLEDEQNMTSHDLTLSDSDYARLKGLNEYGIKEEEKNEIIIPDNKTFDASNPDFIEITGARENNLKGISVNIPKNKMTVITGLSGSGKSSLAFDTIYAESQRRFMDSVSSTGRNFFAQFEKPAVDRITNLPPAIAVEQKAISRNSRSTVGTITDISDLLRLLYARIGTRHCPKCGRAVEPRSVNDIAHLLSNMRQGMSFGIISIKNGKKIEGYTFPDNLKSENITGQPGKQVARQYTDDLKPVVTEILNNENGAFKAITGDDDEYILHTRNHCYYCGISFFELTPSFFSSNNPESMCPDCDGLGTRMKISPDLVVSEPDKSILDGASAWWGDLRKFIKKPTGNWFKGEVLALAKGMKIDLEKPWNKLQKEFRNKALYGTDGEEFSLTYHGSRGRSGDIKRPVEGAVNHIKRLFKDSHGKRSADFLIQFMDEKECETCKGEQLSAEARFITVGARRFPEVMAMSIDSLKDWAEKLPQYLSSEQLHIGNEIIHSIIRKAESLSDVGLHYLSLKRPLPTLSGGEGQRLRLASQLGSGLTNLLYILDEPSAGLHHSDQKRLIKVMRQLRDAGNTLVIVEHDRETMLESDFLVDIGPGAGVNGGNLVAVGSPADIMKNPGSVTGAYLKKQYITGISTGKKLKKPDKWLKLYGANKNNLKNIDISFPLGMFICVTGKSGSGKSSLITHTLSPVLAYYCNHGILLKGGYKKLEGMKQIDNVISITQEAIGRTPRSNPATYTGVFDEIRNIFASTEQARKWKYSANRFSFNSREGQCESCGGEGRKKIEMNFMPDVWITCSECGGKRFNNETLDITYKEKTVADVLAMDIDEAGSFFSEDKRVSDILDTLKDVGLGYLKLGQSALTLSGGEAQRVKLAKELSKAQTGRTMYILDEPTTGLHFQDIEHLLNLLHRIVDAGNTVIVIEHNIDLIRNADWIIDLGPEGGDMGGYVLFEGTPDDIVKCRDSETGKHLRI